MMKLLFNPKTGIETPPPQPLDSCVQCKGSAKALVTVTIQYADGEHGVLELCGSHYDQRSEKLNDMIVGVHDTRDWVKL
jgi:hypothetical protein